MATRTLDIVIAARSMFMRYGFTKTTMSDIAAEAGVARQTVYNAYAGKDEILRAVVRLTGEETRRAVLSAWNAAPTLEDKLSAFHELAPMAWFDAMRAAPDWAALMEGMHSAAAQELEAIEADWLRDLTQVFASTGAPLPMPAEDLADFFYSSSLNAKHGCTDAAHLAKRLHAIKTATLALIQS